MIFKRFTLQGEIMIFNWTLRNGHWPQLEGIICHIHEWGKETKCLWYGIYFKFKPTNLSYSNGLKLKSGLDNDFKT